MTKTRITKGMVEAMKILKVNMELLRMNTELLHMNMELLQVGMVHQQTAMVLLHVHVEEFSTFSMVPKKMRRRKEMEEMVVVVGMAVIVEDTRHLHLAMGLHLQVMVLHRQVMALLVATEGFSSCRGIKRIKTKTRGTGKKMVEVEETCVTAMVLPLVAMGLHPMNLLHLTMLHLTMPQLIQLQLHHTVLLLHHIVLLLLQHLVLLLLLYRPPPAPRCMKRSMYLALRNSAL